MNANWMSDSFQPVPACSGSTNSVHAYCRLAIMIIAISDATSWNQRLLMFTAPAARLREHRAASMFIQQFRAGVDRARGRHRHAQPLAQFHDRADDGFELHRPAGFEILQHRRLVRADFFGAGHSLVDRDRQLDAELAPPPPRFRP